MIDDVCNGGVGEGGVGEGRVGGYSEDGGRRVGIEYVSRCFSTISGNLIVSGAFTDCILLTISCLGANDLTWLRSTNSSEMAHSYSSLVGLRSGGFQRIVE